MGALYEKSRLCFFFFWMLIYLAAQNLGAALSGVVGTDFSVTAVLDLGLSAYLLYWLNRRGLLEVYGLCGIKNATRRELLWFLPLLLVSTFNLWNGIGWSGELPETVFCIVTLVCVGFLEELLVRGFLFRALARRSTRRAVVLSTLFFAGAHLLNTARWPEEVLFQVLGALCFGLLWSVVLLRSGSLWPCILSHAGVDVLSLFGRAEGGGKTLLAMALSLGYLLYLVGTDHRNTCKLR